MVYYVNGQVWRKYFSVNGNQHGECFSFYDDGRVCSKSFYINGKLHGEFIGYHRDGSVDWHYLYVNGELLLDLKESPVDNEEKMLLSLQYGVEWL
jgi:antitoxin component YwqK of YwqJK toxin-antitoxin module